MRELLRRYWPGLVLLGSGSVSILWLAAQGKLGWYVHPRYALFGIVMSLLAVFALLVSAAVLTRRGEADPHTHEAPGVTASASTVSAEDPARARVRTLRSQRIRAGMKIAQIMAVTAAAVVLLIVPPATLTAQSMSHRPDTGELRSSGTGVQGNTVAGGDSGSGSAELGMRELALLLRQQDTSLLTGRSTAVSGFVMPDADDPDNVFVVTRFAITCCAVDAQPLGVPVLQPGWSKEFAEGEWVEATGVFTANPNPASTWPAVVLPSGVIPIDEPEDPYVS